jgi:hypothetical protein
MLNTYTWVGGSGEVREILMTDEVEQFLDTLYASDRGTHKLVNQPSWCWNATAQPKDGRWSTPSLDRRSRT